ncbi:hypothetical protein HUK80_00590 [Flavobacterium sp. MAH-1]|uniref:Uncharacterized protein n=1 Tax=Flavobacterium agri TaxID=2743471 RepID=A0A7Y8XYQ7_9FLAO|nr:hypothetical protein [Flavobacterium agri]NUY79375.1 hypothetical protein [Flavobacterium agri]NYA69399.1 hypothetical protein [Flavobacterium agri]
MVPIILVLCPVLWIISVWMIRKWRFRNTFLIVNLLFFFAMESVLLTTDVIDTGHDRYGYARYIAAFFGGFLHTALAFAISIGINLSLEKNNENADR